MLRLFLSLGVLLAYCYGCMFVLSFVRPESPWSSRAALFSAVLASTLVMTPITDRVDLLTLLFSFMALLGLGIVVATQEEPAYGALGVFYVLYTVSDRPEYRFSPVFLSLALFFLLDQGEVAQAVPDALRSWFHLSLADAGWKPSYLAGADTFFVDALIPAIVVFFFSLVLLYFASGQHPASLAEALDPSANGVENLLRYTSERALLNQMQK